jgi:hypothetical protein
MTIIHYSKGANMPCDYLSRYVLPVIDVLAGNISAQQHTDEIAVFFKFPTIQWQESGIQ